MIVFLKIFVLMFGLTLLSIGIYHFINDRINTKDWLIGDKIKIYGFNQTYELLGWSKYCIYVDKDNITTKFEWKSFQSNVSSDWRKSFNQCKDFMKTEPAFNRNTGQKDRKIHMVNGIPINTLSETECLIYLKECIENEDFETAELIKQRMEQLK